MMQTALMGQKHDRINRDTDVHDAESIRLRREGKLLLLTRKEVVIRILDTAIQMWFGSADPISVHILACVAHKNLNGFAKKMQKPPPTLTQGMKWEDIYSTYDHVRHNEKGGDPNHRDQFVVDNNQIMLFDCLQTFENLFSLRTPWMNTFGAYIVLHRRVPGDFGVEAQNPTYEIFPGIRVSEVIDLSAKAFVKKLYPVFLRAYQSGFY